MVDTQQKATLSYADKTYTYYSLQAIAQHFQIDLSKLPYTIRILLENLLAHLDGEIVTQADIEKLAKWKRTQERVEEIAYYPKQDS